MDDNPAGHTDTARPDLQPASAQAAPHFLVEHEPHEMFPRLVTWGERSDAVRTMLLTSTHAQPHATIDTFSDYDVVLVVRDIAPFLNDRTWIADFGEVLVGFWDPISPDEHFGIEQAGNVMHYADGLKIDFRLWPVELLQMAVRAPTLPPELDAGYRVLLDKDGLTDGMQIPTYRAYIPCKPTEDAYRIAAEECFNDVIYVAKYLWRDELLPAKWCLECSVKDVYLRTMLEWMIQRDNDWSLPVRNLGKGLKQHLPPDIWRELESTYVGAGIPDNWGALFRTVALFRRVAIEVADDLGYVYPEDLHSRVIAHLRAMRLL